MKNAKLLFVLVAMVVMMTATAFSSANVLSKDVATVCAALDNAADEFNRAATEQELVNAMHKFEVTDTDIDLNTILTDADKVALKESLVNFTMISMIQVMKMTKNEAGLSEIEKGREIVEQAIGKLVTESVTLGDFLKNVKK